MCACGLSRVIIIPQEPDAVLLTMHISNLITNLIGNLTVSPKSNVKVIKRAVAVSAQGAVDHIICCKITVLFY